MEEEKVGANMTDSTSETPEEGLLGRCKKRAQKVRQKVQGYLDDGVWTEDALQGGWFRRFRVNLLRFALVVKRGVSEHRLGLYAGGLTFVSLLSVVPVLMLMLLLTKPCGMYEKARSLLIAKTDQAIEQFFEQKGVEKTRLEEAALKLVNKSKPVSPKSETGNGESNPKADVKVDSGASAASGKEFSQQARTLRDQVLSQVDQKINDFNFGLATIVGFLVLAVTVVLTFMQVEASMNEIWHVKTSRSILRSSLLYVGTLMVLPILLVLTMSLPILRTVKNVVDATLGATSYTKWAGDAIIGLLDSSLFSFAVMLFFGTVALSLVFWVVPNRKVQLRAAVEGGLVTALLLIVWLRLCVVAQSVVFGSGAAYGSFALVPILIIWLRYNWQFILLGSNVAYAFQCIHQRVRDLPDIGK